MEVEGGWDVGDCKGRLKVDGSEVGRKTGVRSINCVFFWDLKSWLEMYWVRWLFMKINMQKSTVNFMFAGGFSLFIGEMLFPGHWHRTGKYLSWLGMTLSHHWKLLYSKTISSFVRSQAFVRLEFDSSWTKMIPLQSLSRYSHFSFTIDSYFTGVQEWGEQLVF